MENEKQSELVALIDMDGSAFDYDKSMSQKLERIRSPHEPEFTQEQMLAHDYPAWLENRIQLIRNQPGFWRDLEPIPLGMDVIALLRQTGYSLYIATKGPSQSPNAWSEKLQSVQRHIPDAVMTITQDKGILYGKVLFDDWPPYIERWLQWRPRGIVLMLDHPWNRTFNHPRVIRISSNLDLPTVKEALIARAAG